MGNEAAGALAWGAGVDAVAVVGVELGGGKFA